MEKIRWLVLDWNKIGIDFYKTIGAKFEHYWDLCALYLDQMEMFLRDG